MGNMKEYVGNILGTYWEHMGNVWGIRDNFLLPGGWDGRRVPGEYLADILEFEAESGEWRLVERMLEAREWHAVSVVDYRTVIQFCH